MTIASAPTIVSSFTDAIMATVARRPLQVRLITIAMLAAALLTGWVGIYALGYLVPAFTLTAMAVLLWLGRFGGVLKWVTITNVAAGLLLVFVLAFGDFLGQRKLDVSGIALLTNLVTGGPLKGLLAPGILATLRKGHVLAVWFAQHAAAR